MDLLVSATTNQQEVNDVLYSNFDYSLTLVGNAVNTTDAINA